MRPKQWTKNGFLAAALVFSGQFFDPQRLGRTVLAVMAFNLLSSSGYVLNDYLDREADRRHPKKRLRPIASGSLPEGLALPWMAIILLGGLGIAYWLSPKFLVLSVLYLATTISYSLYFKHKVILDVMFLAACYVWRAIAGAAAIDVRVSPWFFLCTAFFALFLGFAKRKAELVQVGNKAETRKNLREYSQPMLEQFQGDRHVVHDRVVRPLHGARHEHMDDAHHPVRALRRPPVHLPRRAEGRGRVARRDLAQRRPHPRHGRALRAHGRRNHVGPEARLALVSTGVRQPPGRALAWVSYAGSAGESHDPPAKKPAVVGSARSGGRRKAFGRPVP
jgi:hypothetical protein